MDSNQVAQAVAKALRVPRSPGLPLLDAIIEHLHDKKLLLVLDNCEHLIQDCAALVETLLGDSPDLTIFATSREALGVPDEKAWLLPSLSLPDSGLSADIQTVFQSEAISLFIQRVVDVPPDYQPSDPNAPTIAQICTRAESVYQVED